MVVFVEHSLCRKPKLQKMNRSEIPSDVAPSEIHIGDQISDYKMLSGKILNQVEFKGLSQYASLWGFQARRNCDKLYDIMHHRFSWLKKGMKMTVERTTLNAYILYDIEPEPFNR